MKVILILDKLFWKYDEIQIDPSLPPEETSLKKPSKLHINVRTKCMIMTQTR